jgi:hypothetical protein
MSMDSQVQARVWICTLPLLQNVMRVVVGKLGNFIRLEQEVPGIEGKREHIDWNRDIGLNDGRAGGSSRAVCSFRSSALTFRKSILIFEE